MPNRNMPLTLISSLIDPHTLKPVMPSSERQTFFEQATSLPFHMSLVTDNSDVVTLDCPFCMQKNHLVQWVTPDEKGYAQPNFEFTCELCRQKFNKSSIGVRRFAEVISKRRTAQKAFLS